MSKGHFCLGLGALLDAQCTEGSNGPFAVKYSKFLAVVIVFYSATYIGFANIG